MKRIEIIPYTLGTHFAALVANGDVSHLTDEYVQAFTELDRSARDNAPDGYIFSHWSVSADETEFARCDATGLKGDCCLFEAVYFHKNA